MSECKCGNDRKEDWHLVCVECWSKLPEYLRNDLYHTYLMVTHSPKADEWKDHHKSLIGECLNLLFPHHKAERVEEIS